MDARSRSGLPAPSTVADPPTLDDLLAGARRRLLAALVVLPVGVLLVMVAARVSLAAAGESRWGHLAAGGSALQVGLLVPRVLRVWRLGRARRRAVRHDGARDLVQLAVVDSGPLSVLPGIVAVWRAGEGDRPARLDAVDRSARPLVDGGRLWATVAAGPHRFATYWLEDGTPVVAAGRTNVSQRWQARGRIRDLQRRGVIDRRPDAPYPSLAVTGDLATEVRIALVPVVVVVVLVAAVGLLSIVPPITVRGGP